MNEKQTPASEQLIRRAERRDRAARGVAVVLLVLLTLTNIYVLAQLHLTQQQIASFTRGAARQQEQLLKQANSNAEANHAEVIRYLRCIALLQPPYAGNAMQLDNCIATSRLPDAQQSPPISVPNSTQSNAASGQPSAPTRSSTGKATPSQPSASQQTQPTQQQNPAPTNIVQSVLKAFGL